MKTILILIDIQKEYTTKGRPFYLKGIEKSLENCQQLLQHARENQWEIVHVQHTNGTGVARFDAKSEFFGFVPGFEPSSGEKHFIKRDFSCYSSAEFSDYMNQVAELQEETRIYLIGYNSVMCCLSTMEEARRRGHKVWFVTDASYAKAIGDKSESETHEFMLNLYKQKNLATLVFSQSILSQNDLHMAPQMLFNRQLSSPPDNVAPTLSSEIKLTN